MTKEEAQLISFQVIANSGDAFDCFVRAVEKARCFDFEASEDLMKQGAKAMIEAHRVQTELLQAEINGEEIPFSIVLIHGQDHLMHAMNYEQSAKDLIALYRKLSESNTIK